MDREKTCRQDKVRSYELGKGIKHFENIILSKHSPLPLVLSPLFAYTKNQSATSQQITQMSSLYFAHWQGFEINFVKFFLELLSFYFIPSGKAKQRLVLLNILKRMDKLTVNFFILGFQLLLGIF